jgi:hypothetical protein
MKDGSITEILLTHFATDKSLKQIQQDYEDLELMIERERTANGEDSRHLAALNVLARFQLQLVVSNTILQNTGRN